MLGQLHQPNATLKMFILCRVFPLCAVLVILGISLKLGQVITALIANVSEMSFTSSLDLGCLPSNWDTLFFFSPTGYKAPNKPAVQVSRNWSFFFFFPFFFSFSSSFLVELEALVKNSYVNPLQGANVLPSALPGKSKIVHQGCVYLCLLPPSNPIPHFGITA